MNTDELKKELAEFAEFEWREFELVFGGPPRPRTGWYIDGSYHGSELPDFPNDLSAIFKYLIPEMDRRYGQPIALKTLIKWISAIQDYDKAAEELCGIILELIEEK